MFQAIEKHCKAPYGYAEFNDVTNVDSGTKDVQESFFLAETLKYLYLLQSPDHTVSLESFVFNTEAHPFRITNR
jgi:mannosyl-oligosaccharide alpha-1,2-mannosidase